MLSYLNAETGFIRAFGNRSLLLIFLCALSRSGDHFGKASALGVSLDLNPGLIAIFGPVLALLFLISLKVEADALLVARETVLEEVSRLNRNATKVSWWVLLLFAVPFAAATFMTVQFILNVVPSKAGCTGYVWTRKFTDFSFQAGFAIDLLYSQRDRWDAVDLSARSNLFLYRLPRRVPLSDLPDCHELDQGSSTPSQPGRRFAAAVTATIIWSRQRLS